MSVYTQPSARARKSTNINLTDCKGAVEAKKLRLVKGARRDARQVPERGEQSQLAAWRLSYVHMHGLTQTANHKDRKACLQQRCIRIQQCLQARVYIHIVQRVLCVCVCVCVQ